jgi:hypothetical protein
MIDSARCTIAQPLAGMAAAALWAAVACGQTGYFGIATIDVTPTGPVMLSGYSSRSSLPEATGVQQNIFAQAAAFGIGADTSLLLSVDCTGVPDNVVDPLALKLGQQFGIAPERIVVASTHSHSCPHVTGYLSNLFSPPLTQQELQHVDAYASLLSQRLEQVAATALANRTPGHQMSWGNGEVDFGKNRRGTPIAPNDHDLPVLLVRDALGAPEAIIASYATHAVTLNPSDNLVSGDWPGYARQEIEARYPGATAMMLIGAGADSNPNAFGLAAAQSHGQSVADEVQRLVGGGLLTPVSSQLAAYHSELQLDYATELTPGDPPSARLAPGVASAMYGVTTWTFGDDLAMVFMEGEVVSDYSLRLKAELGPKVWVNGYSNDVQGYIPSERILYEGGYEADSATYYYDVPGRFAHGLEDKIVGAVHEHLRDFPDATDILHLEVDWGTGEVAIANSGHETVELEAYTIVSPPGLLKTTGGGWNSLQAQGIAGWDRADNSNSFRITEFNPLGSASFAPGASISLGAALATVPPAKFGAPFTAQDLHFEYQTLAGGVVDAPIRGSTIDAPENNLVLTIDPATGEAAIQNASPFFDVSITAYTIASEIGGLRPADGHWNSLEDQSIAGWDQASGSNSFRVSEFNILAATQLPGGGTVLNLGALFDTGGGAWVDALDFEFLLDTGEVLKGVIRLGPLPTLGNHADFDADGDVEGADFLKWQQRLGTSVDPHADPDGDGVISAADLNVWKANSGAAAPGLSSAHVPEPAAASLLIAAAVGALSRRSGCAVRRVSAVP